jgi:hypothetical protein
LEKETKIIKKDKEYFKGRIVVFAFKLGGILFFYWALYMVNQLRSTSFWAHTVFAIYLSWHILKTVYATSKKVTITKNTITYQSFLKKRTLKFSEIKGHELGYYKILGYKKYWFNRDSDTSNPVEGLANYLKAQELLYIIPKKGSGKRKIKCFRSEELREWVLKNTKEVYQIEEQKVVDATIEEKTKIETIKAFNQKNGFRIIVYLGVLFIIPSPMIITLSISLLSVIFVFASILYYRGTMRLEFPSPYPQFSFFIVFMLSVTFMFGKYNTLNYDFTEDKNVLIIASIITLLYIVFIGLKNFRLKMLVTPLLFIFIMLHTVKYSVNYIFNFKAPVSYQTTILSITSKKGDTETGPDYFVQLKSWKNHSSKDLKLGINRADYSRFKKGDTIQVKEYSGVFYPWYKASKNNKEIKYKWDLTSFIINQFKD